MQPARGVKRWIVNREMDPRFKCGVKVVNAVAGEEHYTAVIFEFL
jgi:hypothetical protein